MEKYKVLFVCLGNICRSPAAEGIFKNLVMKSGLSECFVIDSAGTGRYHIGDLPDSRMRRQAARRGITLDHRCRQVCDEDFERFDLIIGMDDNNISNLRRMAPSPQAQKKIHSMAEFIDRDKFRYDHVPDPYYEGTEGFELVLDLLENACSRLLDSFVHDSRCCSER